MSDRRRMGGIWSRIAATAAVALMVCGGTAIAAEADEGPAQSIRAQESKPGLAPEDVSMGASSPLQTMPGPTNRVLESDPSLQPPSWQASGRNVSTDGDPAGPVQDTDAGHRFWSPGLMALTILVGTTLLVAMYLFVRSRRAPKSTKGKRK